MSIKTIALASAAAFALTGTAALADTGFGVGSDLDHGTNIDLGLIISDFDGTVSLYDFDGGVRGELLGSAPVQAGANANVDVNADTSFSRRAIAVIEADGRVLATKVFDVPG